MKAEALSGSKFTGSKSAKFTIIPKKPAAATITKIKSSKPTVNVTWKKVACTGYELQVSQNSDPSDATDLGAPNSRVAVPFHFGDPSTSHSEKYRLELEPIAGPGETPTGFSWVNANYGECETKTAMLKEGWKYAVRMYHSGTSPQYHGTPRPDYDYSLQLVASNLPPNVVLSDPSGLFGENGNSGERFTGEGKVAYVYVHAVTNVSICKPDGNAWVALEPGRVVLDDEVLRIKVDVFPQVGTLEKCKQMFGDMIIVKTSGTCQNGVSMLIGDDVEIDNTYGHTEIRIVKTRQQLKSLGLLPVNDNDGVNEMAWMDIVEMAGQSYADSEAFAGLAYQFRGKATSDNTQTLESTPPNSVPSESFFKAAGCEVVTAEYCGFISPKRQIMNQADFFYYSGHGSLSGGSLQGGFSPTTITSEWSKDLTTVVFSGCAVLNIGRYRSKSFKSTAKLRWALKTFCKTNISPGMAWMGKGPKYYLGYCWRAPLDDKGASDIAASFVANMSLGMDVVNAWKFANNNYDGRNACVIDCSGSSPVFWYWDETGAGPVWTAIQKGTPLWP